MDDIEPPPQEVWATAQAHYAATEELALHRVRGAGRVVVHAPGFLQWADIRLCRLVAVAVVLRPPALLPPTVGVHYALEHPTTASAVALTSAVVLLPVTRRAVWAATVGRLRSDAAVLDAAQRRAQGLTQALDDQQKEIAKLTERAQLAADEYARGRAKLLAAGGQLRRLAGSARRLESKAAACVDDVAHVRLRHGGTDAHAGVVAQARQAAAEASTQRVSVERHLRMVANLVPV